MEKKKIRPLTIVKLALVVLLVVGVIAIVRQQASERQGAEDYAQAAEMAGGPSVSPPEAPEGQEEPRDPNAAALAETDLAALQEVNPQVMGWIWIPGTELSYPILQGGDNDYYLDHTWKGEPSALGAVFLDYRNHKAMDEFNTLIYGHRMRNETMFGALKHYKDPAFLETAPAVYVLDESGVRKYDIFAAYEARVDAAVYTPGLTTQSEKAEVLSTARECNVLESGIEPTTADNILTLVTCTGRGYADRWLVQAVEVEI